MNANKKESPWSKPVVSALFIIVLIVLYTILTSEQIMGRRVAKLVAYRLDFRYWPNWYSIILWIVSFGFLNVLLVQWEPFQKLIGRVLQHTKSQAVRDMPTKYYARFVVLFYIASIAVVLSWLFWDAKPFWRYLRYKLYAEYFQNPMILLTQDGRFTAKILTGPILIGVLFILYYMFKKKGKKYFLVFLILCPSNPYLMAKHNDNKRATTEKIHLLQQAEYKIVPDIQKISETPSTKNTDGGYNADVSILQCFAVMNYYYAGGRYDNEEIRFRMRFPLRAEQGKKYPLIVWFHGFGESTGDNERHLAHLHRAIASFSGKDALDFYMIAVQCPPDNPTWGESISPEGKGDSRLAVVGEIMENVVKEYPIDENRISVVGISSGATATWDFVAQNAGKIAGQVAFSGTPSATLSPDSFQKTAIWAFNNRGDVGASWKATSDFIDGVNALGGNGYVTLQEHGIHDSWSYPLKNKNVLEWLVSQTLDGEGLLQDASYPQRSFAAIFLMFLLPIVIIIYFTTCRAFPIFPNGKP